MRKATFAALVGASAMVVGVRFASADTSLFDTINDFGASNKLTPNPYTGFPLEPHETNWQGFGTYNNSSEAITHLDSLTNTITFQATTLANPTSTIIGTNGLGDLDNLNPASGSGRTADASLGTGWAGYHAPLGSMTIDNYQGASELESNGGPGGYDVITSGEMYAPQGTASSATSTASTAFINALAAGQAMAIDFTAPGGGTTLVPDGLQTTSTNPYYLLDFGTSDSTASGGLNSGGGGWINPTFTITNKDTGAYGDDPGSFVVTNGTGATSYWTAYLPYSYAAATTATFLQFHLILNADGFVGGNVTIDNIRTVSPTWAGPGSGLSWTTNTSVTATDWIGGLPGGAVGGASGASATMADIETGNATTNLDTTWTLGTLTFNTLLYTYNIAPGSGGSLVMDNTINSADAVIDDMAGGSATSGGGSAPNYTEYVTAPVQLNSNTDVTVARSTDVLDITGSITGTGALSMAGAGTLQLFANNTYSGGTTVNSGTVLVSSSGALPTNKPVTVNGGLLEIASTIAGGNLTLSALTITGGKVQVADNASAGTALGTSNVVLASLSITGNGVLDIGNNRIIIDYTTGHDPISSIAAWIANGFSNQEAAGIGPSIISSDIAADDAASGLSYGIGYADGADGAIAGLPSGEIEIMFTLLGDANLDGTVNSEDFTPLSQNLNKPGGWDQGDFNYDGTVNAEDFTPFSHNLNQTDSLAAMAGSLEAANGLSLANVPEPASMGLLVAAGVGVLARRRRTVRQ